MKSSITPKKIREIITGIKSGTLLPDPKFQRRLVWNNSHKIAFIDTILRGFPFPEIYIANGELNPDTAEGVDWVVDGQQRVSTLVEYFEGSDKIKIRDEIPPFSELDDSRKKEFLNYDVVVRHLGNMPYEEILEIFHRINSTNYSLNAMEIENARYDGAFKKFGERISTHEFFERHRVFKVSEIRRMVDLRFALTFVYSIMANYPTKEKEIERFLDRYNDRFDAADRIWDEIQELFAFVDALNLDSVGRAWKLPDLLTLLVEIYQALFRERLNIDAGCLCARLSEFYLDVDKFGQNDDPSVDPKVHTYYISSTGGKAHNRTDRIKRGNIIAEIIGGCSTVRD